VSFSVNDKDLLIGHARVRDEAGMAIVSVPLASEIARVTSDDIRVAFLYELAAPYFVSRVDAELPKIDWPFENIIHQKIVYGELDAVAIFNFSSGVVYRLIELGGSSSR